MLLFNVKIAFNLIERFQRRSLFSFNRFYAKKPSKKPKPTKKSVKYYTLLEHLCNLPFTESHPPDLRLSNIICTIGPSSRNEETLEKLMGAGMRIARLNFSHGTHEYHAGTIEIVRNAIKKFSKTIGYECPVAIALDTKGPEIRTGFISGGDAKATAKLEKGKTVKVTTDGQYKDKCSDEIIYVDYENITKIVKPDNKIFLDDGLISLIVKDVKDKEITCEIESGGKLGSQKGANLPGIPVDLPAVSEKDKEDLRFGVDHCVDIIFASFIRDAKSISEIREVLGKEGEDTYIISKIENQQGLDNIDSIIDACDGIMMARGDLGIEIDPERVFLAQKGIIARCNRAGKVAICATQMLESMTDRPRSTRAEASDVANAIIDGADCVMLSGETAKGKYPLECVQTMAKICRYAEGSLWYDRMLHDMVSAADDDSSSKGNELLKGFAVAATSMTLTKEIGAIVVIDCDGELARYISRLRPHCPIIAIMADEKSARQAVLYRAIYPIVKPKSSNKPEKLITKVVESMKNALFLKDDDQILAIYEQEFGSKETTIMKTRKLR